MFYQRKVQCVSHFQIVSIAAVCLCLQFFVTFLAEESGSIGRSAIVSGWYNELMKTEWFKIIARESTKFTVENQVPCYSKACRHLPLPLATCVSAIIEKPL